MTVRSGVGRRMGTFGARFAHLLVGTAAALVVASTTAVAGATTTSGLASPPVVLRGAEVIAGPASRDQVVATGATGQATVAWTGIYGGVHAIYTSDLLADGSWSTPAPVPGSDGGENPRIAMAPGGATVVAWETSNGQPSGIVIGIAVRPAAGAFAPAQFVGRQVVAGSTSEDATVAIDDALQVRAAWSHTELNAVNDPITSVEAVHATGTGPFSTVQRIGGADASFSSPELASAPSIAMDASGRAVLLFTYTPDGSTDNRIRQTTAPADGNFTTASNLDPAAEDWNDLGNDPHVAANADGAIAATWRTNTARAGCTPTCTETDWTTAGLGTTTTGVTHQQHVTNAVSGTNDPVTGPGRSPWLSAVAIDELGNAVVAWEDDTATASTDEVWTVHAGPGSTQYGSSQGVASTTLGNQHQVGVAAAGGRQVVTWRSAVTGGAETLHTEQGLADGDNKVSWDDDTVYAPDVPDGNDLSSVSLSANGLAVYTWQLGGQSTAVNTNAVRMPHPPTVLITPPATPVAPIHLVVPPLDASKPQPVLPRNNSTATVAANGAFPWNVGCPRTEARCHGSVVFDLYVSVPSAPSSSANVSYGRIKLIRGARASFDLKGGKTAHLKVKLGTAAKAALTKYGTLKCRATVTTVDAAGNRSTVVRTIKLKHGRIKLIR